jgi:hypothetical protein
MTNAQTGTLVLRRIGFTVTKLKLFAMAALMAAAVTAGGLAIAQPAEAAPLSCAVGTRLFWYNISLGDEAYGRGDWVRATFFYRKADAIAAATSC